MLRRINVIVVGETLIPYKINVIIGILASMYIDTHEQMHPFFDCKQTGVRYISRNPEINAQKQVTRLLVQLKQQ